MASPGTSSRVALARQLEKEGTVRDVYADAKAAGVLGQYRDEKWFALAKMTKPPGLQLTVELPGDAEWMAQTAAHAAGPPLPGMTAPEAPPNPAYFPDAATAEATYIAALAGDAEAVAEALSTTRERFEKAVEEELALRKEKQAEAAAAAGGGEEEETEEAALSAVRAKLGWAIIDCHHGHSALAHACTRGKLATVQALVEAGANVRAASRDGVGALHKIGAFRGLPHSQLQLISRVEILTGRPPPPGKQQGSSSPERDGADDANGGDGAGSAEGKQAEEAAAIAELLIARGADVHSRAEDGSTPLHACGRDGRCVPVLHALLAGGASPTARDGLGVTPLMAACAGGDVPIVQAMLDSVRSAAEAAANAEVAEAEAAGTELPEGTPTAEAQATRAVKEAMAMADAIGMQPLHHALDGGHTSVALLLVEKGAQAVATTRGRRPLKKLHPLAARTLLKQVNEMRVEMGIEPGEATYSEYGSIGSRPSTAHRPAQA